MGLNIPFPITVDELKRNSSKFVGTPINRDGIYVDDFDDVIRCMFNNINIEGFTIDKRVLEHDIVIDLDTPNFDFELRRHIHGRFNLEVKE